MPDSTHMGFAEGLGGAADNPPDPRVSGYQLLIGDLPEHTVSTCEQGIKAQFEQWVRRGARAAASSAENDGDWFEASRLRSLFQHEYTLGFYSWGGRKCLAARQIFEGKSYLLYLLIRRCEPRITEEEVDRLMITDMRECGEAVQWSLGNSPPPPRRTRAGETTTTAAPIPTPKPAPDQPAERTPTTFDGP